MAFVKAKPEAKAQSTRTAKRKKDNFVADDDDDLGFDDAQVGAQVGAQADVRGTVVGGRTLRHRPPQAQAPAPAPGAMDEDGVEPEKADDDNDGYEDADDAGFDD